jgi:hypothetical protein
MPNPIAHNEAYAHVRAKAAAHLRAAAALAREAQAGPHSSAVEACAVCLDAAAHHVESEAPGLVSQGLEDAANAGDALAMLARTVEAQVDAPRGVAPALRVARAVASNASQLGLESISVEFDGGDASPVPASNVTAAPSDA